MAPFLFVMLSEPTCATAEDLRFVKRVINEETDYSAAALIDVNRDGRLDVVCGADWYEAPNWDKHFVVNVPRISGRPDGFAHLEFDVNRDGWMDVITVNYRSRSIKWVQHPGQLVGGIDADWKMHTVAEPGPMETGRLVDIDGDGQLDLLPNGRNFAAWWEFRWGNQAGSSEPAWIRNDLPKEANGHGSGFGDIDSDGLGDVVGQNGWLKAPEDTRNGTWKWHPEFSIERGSVPLLVVDPDQDGDNDIVWCSAHGFGVYWLEQIQDSNGMRKWLRHAIDTSWSQGHSPLWADLDGDGQGELIAGKRYFAHAGSDPGAYDSMNVYRYQFNLKTNTWDRWPVSLGDRISMGLDPKVADIDNDGDLDLLTSGRSGLYWLENMGAGTSVKTEASDFVARNGGASPNDLQSKQSWDDITDSTSAAEWGKRRSLVVSNIEQVHGGLPSASDRVALDVSVVEQIDRVDYSITNIRYQIDFERHVTAQLYVPRGADGGLRSGVVCMFDSEHAEVAKQTAKELVICGYVCVVPQLVESSKGDSVLDGTWQAMRAADLLQATNEVHGERIGFIGDAFDGILGLHVAALDQRFVATFSDASRLQESTVVSTTQYSLAELIAAVAPRSLRVSLPKLHGSEIFVKDNVDRSRRIYSLRKASSRLTVTSSTANAADQIESVKWLKGILKPVGK